MQFVLLHSPLVGPLSWSRVAPLLEAEGHSVGVPDLRPAMQAAGNYYDSLSAIAAAAVTSQSVLAVHSGAGALVPAVAARAPIDSAIFVDALLPHPGTSWFDGVPVELRERLKGLAKEGMLPPWHAWWPKRAMDALMPDAALRGAFLREQADLPLGYFEEAAPDLPLTMPFAYLQLSAAYRTDADTVEAAGWPVERLDLNHLAVLSEPERVAGAILSLAEKLARAP